MKSENKWNKINSENFSKQYYYNNFLQLSWSYKNNENKKNIIKGTFDTDGYKKISLYDKDNKRKIVYEHRFIFQIFNTSETGCNKCKKDYSIFDIFLTKHSIDHINGNKKDNNPKNLQRLCQSCHNKKTLTQTKNTRKKSSITQSIPIICYIKNDTNYKEVFSSSIEASNKFKIKYKTLLNNAVQFEKGEIKWIQDKFRFEKYKELLKNEEFKIIPNMENVYASNKGRIKLKTGRIFIGSERDRFKITIDKKPYLVHVLILKAWKYDELKQKAIEIKNSFKECENMNIDDIINSYNKKYSIVCDHIDKNQKNNCLENLRWSTKKENAKNQDSVKKIKQYSKDGKTFIKQYDCQSDAFRDTGASHISAACNGIYKTSGGFVWKFL